jgi:hypothetical protein
MNAARLVPDEIVTALLFPPLTFTSFYSVIISFLRYVRNELFHFVDAGIAVII